MSTAAEVMLLAQSLDGRVHEMGEALERWQRPLFEGCMLQIFGREVSAKRARKLRRRGEDVRFARRTETGKCRYRWLPKLEVAWRA